MSKTETNLGSSPPPGAARDAVHVAVIPILAVREMRPGERLQSGIVDPFLTAPVPAGRYFWLCLYPGTVTSLRHVWTHTAFAAEPAAPEKARSEADVWASLPCEREAVQ